MENELTVLLVEDDQSACEEIIQYIDTLEDVLLTGITNNSAEAIDMIRDNPPDAVILDLELHLGSGNGLMLLQELQQMNLFPPPYILVTTNNSSAVTYESARQLGTDFILCKHQADYSSRSAVDFLRMMKSVIKKRRRHSNTHQMPLDESSEQRSRRIVQKISLELNNVGISPKAVGYQYLIDGIQIVMNEPTPNLCHLIAKKHKKSSGSIERAMHNAIARAWRTTPIDELLYFYTARISSEKGMPTINEFIYYYANKLKNEH